MAGNRERVDSRGPAVTPGELTEALQGARVRLLATEALGELRTAATTLELARQAVERARQALAAQLARLATAEGLAPVPPVETAEPPA
jgi:hypothetical protein